MTAEARLAAAVGTTGREVDVSSERRCAWNIDRARVRSILGTFMRERIFDPLDMKDTAFYVPPEKIDRLPAFYFFNRQKNELDLFDVRGKQCVAV